MYCYRRRSAGSYEDPLPCVIDTTPSVYDTLADRETTYEDMPMDPVAPSLDLSVRPESLSI